MGFLFRTENSGPSTKETNSMSHRLTFSDRTLGMQQLAITGSKSETNRLLILMGLYPSLTINNASQSDDSKVLTAALRTKDSLIDVHHAGTAMRFLTSYLAVQQGQNFILTGSERMQQRPIGVLVDALRDLGASIEYVANEGYPPLKITGVAIAKNQVSIQANVSSQYISSLMLIAPSLPLGLTITLVGKVTSVPYIKMTVALLNEIGVQASFSGQTINVEPLKNNTVQNITVESDWSSASYFYSLVALSKNASITLSSYKQNSRQGDAALATIFEQLGVSTTFDANSHSIQIASQNKALPKSIELDLANTPDLAQTIAVCCFGLGIACELKGLHTLKIKETDRLVALEAELSKLGASCQITNNSLSLAPSNIIKEEILINTYQDHRMAMAFAPLALLVPIVINEPEVVSKSFPSFWKDLKAMGAQISE